jgi:valyl-tRNA synthetase
MGHALCYTIQDVLGRWKRMQGYQVLVLPGTDHAGIATQKVVESQLKREGLTRFDLGREEFLKRVWKWKEESGGMILRQFRRLGFAFDWTRDRFTMDPAYQEAVLRVFINWFDRGLIYRGKRVINWDPALRTSVSDIEVYDEVRKGKLYFIRYPFAEEEGYLVVATTRPETMLADVAVAAHPDDERYQPLFGKKLRLPLVGRIIPFIADPYPNPAFGTGAVKITPAHDPNDFEVGKRMNLDFNDPSQVPVCIDESARIHCPETPYHGLDRFDARERIVQDLQAQGLIERIEDYDVPLKIGDRSGEIIEPLLSEQWFCEMKPLAEPAIEVVRQGKIRFVPERYTDIYLRWMENIKDWCVSRQLWWGHRIPVYYTSSGKPVAALSPEEAERKAGEPITHQDPDVLDTWFSSALWPFATLGWPQETEDLKKYYPTDVLATDRNIIYLWVARMIMAGLDQMKEIPFRTVYIYATVLTEEGKRMSKSLGTGIDPLEYIDRFGADAMRFSLLLQTGYNQEIRFGEKRIQEARNFCNKIWNACRFVLLNIDPSAQNPLPSTSQLSPLPLRLEDRWILSRLHHCTLTVNLSLQNYNMMEATKALYEFFWSEFCDWYVEIVKPRLQSQESKHVPQSVLLTVLHAFCRLAHPFMPHITEEIYHLLPGVPPERFLDYEPFPLAEHFPPDPQAEVEMEYTIDVIKSARHLRHEMGITPLKTLPELYLENFTGDPDLVRSQAWFEQVKPGKPQGPHISDTTRGVDIHLPLPADLNIQQEVNRLTTKWKRLSAELQEVRSRLANPQFLAKASPEIVQREQEQAQLLDKDVQKLQSRLEDLKKLMN